MFNTAAYSGIKKCLVDFKNLIRINGWYNVGNYVVKYIIQEYCGRPVKLYKLYAPKKG